MFMFRFSTNAYHFSIRKLSTYLKQQLELEKFPDRLTHFLANVLGITDKSILEFRRKYHMISPEQFVDVIRLFKNLKFQSMTILFLFAGRGIGVSFVCAFIQCK